jgi:Flp pilus assembly protein TadG
MNSRRSDARGQSLVEFALVLPIFILVLMGLFDLGRGVYAYNTLSNASREAARVAIVNQVPATVQAEAVKQAVGLGITGANVTIAYAESDGTVCTAPYNLSCIASITVTYQFTAATPVISQIVGPFPISATTEMVVERTCPDPPGLATCL